MHTPKVKAVNTNPIQVRFLPGLEMAPATWRINEGRLTLKAQRGERLTARLEVGDLSAALFSLKGASLEGKIQGQIDLSGDLQHPDIQGQLTWGPGKWGDFAFRSFKPAFSYREESLNLKGSLEEKAAGPRLVWDGHIPLNLSVSPLRWAWGERELDFRLQGEKANLALLTALSPEVLSAGGSLDIMAEWQGRPASVPGSRARSAGGREPCIPPGRQAVSAPAGGSHPPGGQTADSRNRLGKRRHGPPQRRDHPGGDLTPAGRSPGQLQDFVVLRRGGAEAAGNGSSHPERPLVRPLLKGQPAGPQGLFPPRLFPVRNSWGYHSGETPAASHAPRAPPGRGTGLL